MLTSLLSVSLLRAGVTSANRSTSARYGSAFTLDPDFALQLILYARTRSNCAPTLRAHMLMAHDAKHACVGPPLTHAVVCERRRAQASTLGKAVVRVLICTVRVRASSTIVPRSKRAGAVLLVWCCSCAVRAHSNARMRS